MTKRRSTGFGRSPETHVLHLLPDQLDALEAVIETIEESGPLHTILDKLKRARRLGLGDLDFYVIQLIPSEQRRVEELYHDFENRVVYLGPSEEDDEWEEFQELSEEEQSEYFIPYRVIKMAQLSSARPEISTLVVDSLLINPPKQIVKGA